MTTETQHRVAIFHNFMDNIGGAEVVSLTLARAFEAPIYTTNIAPDKITAMGFADVLPRIHSIGTIPIQAPFRHQFCVWRFRHLNLGHQYDQYIISGDWAMAAAVNHHPNVWYVHSPLNELWAFKNYVKKIIIKPWQRPLFELWVQWNRWLTRRYARWVDTWVCNSENTRKRIGQYYNRQATVIYPPVDTSHYQNNGDKGYWLSVNRIVRHKRIEMQLEAFAQLPDEKLVIVGSYEESVAQFEGYKAEILAKKPPNVEILHWVDQSELCSLYNSCRGFIATAKDEDFGMTVVEALAAGKPVIAAAEGGFLESLSADCGLLIDNISADKLALAVRSISQQLQKHPEMFVAPAVAAAGRFDTTQFVEQIRRVLDTLDADVR